MSCENENVEYWRLVQKYSTISGVTPTIPPSQDHSDGTWSDTDLYIGEFFMNVSDNLLWYRTIDGIHLVSGATGASGSFVGDYVPTSGGTYSGGVFAPTFSSNTITSALITASAFDGQIFGSSGSVFYGDGSNLTGIVVGWNGGTVSNPVDFVNNVSFGNPIVVNGPISTVNDCVDFQSDICVNGGVSASYFIGDGSGLTGIVATYSDTYTTDAYLQGSSIYFDRTNGGTASYFVDLSPILATYSILTTNWDPNTSEFQITTNGGDTFTETINEFASLNVQTTVTANQFYGTFNGTFSNDIYTTSATLYGTDAVFMRTDGGSYSLDLSSFSGGGSGSVGPTGPAGATGSTPYMVISYTSTGLTLATGSVTLPITTTLLIGWSQGTRVRIWNDATHYMEGQITTAMTYPQLAGNDIVVNVDYVVGTGTLGVWKVGVAGDPGSMGASASQTLAQTLVLGNNTGNNDIELNNSTFTGTSDGIVPYNTNLDIATFTFEDLTGSGSWAPTIKLQNGAIKGQMLFDVGTTLIQNTYVSGPINRYGELRVTDTSVELSADDLATGDSTSFDMASTSMVVSSTTATFQGVEYASDYSANFTNRSLVDKEYVDTHSGSGITYSGQTDYLTFFDTNNSLSYTSMHYNSGRYTIGWGAGWSYDNIATLGVYTPYTTGPAVVAEGSQFGGLFIASGANGGQNIGLQAQASNGQISGNLGFYSLANGTASNNIGGYFVASGGTLYPGYGGYSNLGVEIYVDSNTNTGVGVTNSGINIQVYGRGGDNNYIGQFRDGSEGVGKVLTCVSADGLARWQTPTGGGGGGTFSGGTVSGATTFQSDVTFQANVIDENGTSIDMTNIINMTNLSLMYNT